MKKVRFESPLKRIKMDESECHSPRPFVQKQVRPVPHVEYLDFSTVPFSNDPVKRFEYGNSSPYPIVKRTLLQDSANLEKNWNPSNDLDLSILDATTKTPMKACHIHHKGHTYNIQPISSNINTDLSTEKTPSNILITSSKTPPNILRKNDDFFLRRDNLTGQHQLGVVNRLYLDKENNPQLRKTQIMMMGHKNLPINNLHGLTLSDSTDEIDDSNCKCHHCIRACDIQHVEQPGVEIARNQNISQNNFNVCHCVTMLPKNQCTCNIPSMKTFVSNCNCNCNSKLTYTPRNGVDKKTWAIKKYEQNKNTECLEVDNQMHVSIDKNEPTVGDLFKIIKMQSEQLKLLQEKVDKVISSKHEEQRTCLPIQNCISDVARDSARTEHKISIGVMTSFEVVHTSTIINKEVVKQSEAQIQCNRSQISIKEVVSKQPSNLNFLDGLTPITKQAESHEHVKNHINDVTNIDSNVDKTLNEMSLYNVEVDNAITPNMSPEQSLYLDVRDYSDSDASCDEDSNVGWTYYNKVITHVNGMLHESDMPSSASALYRNVRQKCLQIQGDKSNISVAKRVTFGDDKLCLQKPNIPKPTTDTSLKMRQLAVKYLKDGALHTPSPITTDMPVDTSLATRQYMEKHRILKGTNIQCCNPQMDIPKFLDITALKQQPKLL